MCYMCCMDISIFNITWAGSNGETRDPVPYDSSDAQLQQIATECVRAGDVPGIPADPNADFTNFMVDRFPATDEHPNRIFLRPKTPFGEAR